QCSRRQAVNAGSLPSRSFNVERGPPLPSTEESYMKRQTLTHSIGVAVLALLLVACDQSTEPRALSVPAFDRVGIAASSVTVTPSSGTLAPGQTVQLIAQVQNPSGKPQTNPRQLVWSSGDPGIATVNSSGMVTAIAAGIDG